MTRRYSRIVVLVPALAVAGLIAQCAVTAGPEPKPRVSSVPYVISKLPIYRVSSTGEYTVDPSAITMLAETLIGDTYRFDVRVDGPTGAMVVRATQPAHDKLVEAINALSSSSRSNAPETKK